MSQPVDDKIQSCLDFVLHQLQQRSQERSNDTTFFVGISGVQGCGKTTLVSTLADKLRQAHSLPTIVFSIDDLYLSREKQAELAAKHPNNPLIQHRGQPSTHDVNLGKSLFFDLRAGRPVKIPAFDKSAFQGAGDRLPEERWEAMNQSHQPMTKVVLFEGWCVGFRPLPLIELKRKWDIAVAQARQGEYHGQLGYTRFEDIKFINNALHTYDPMTDQLDALIHIDAEDNIYVYQWRLEQEANLRKTKGSGMTNEEVVSFVDNYYPAYELYADRLREAAFEGGKARLRIVLGRDRKKKQLFIT